MKIELLHISAVKETQYFSYIDLNLNMYIPYNFIHLMRKSPWDLRGGNLEQQNIFSFQFTYIAEVRKQEHSQLHHHGYELMQKETVWPGQLLCTEIFQKKCCLGTETLPSELHLKTCLSLLYLLCHKLRTYFKTTEAQSIGFFTARVWLL